jgi:hypothetical protein
MATFIAVYHSGVVITNEIGSYDFIGMKETFLLNEFLTHANVVRLKVELISVRAMAPGRRRCHQFVMRRSGQLMSVS